MVEQNLSDLPAELGGDQVAVGRILGGIGVHHAHQPLPAPLRLHRLGGAQPELLEHRVQPGQQRAVEGVVGGEQQRRRRYLVEHLVVGLLVRLAEIVVVRVVGREVIGVAKPTTFTLLDVCSS